MRLTVLLVQHPPKHLRRLRHLALVGSWLVRLCPPPCFPRPQWRLLRPRMMRVRAGGGCASWRLCTPPCLSCRLHPRWHLSMLPAARVCGSGEPTLLLPRPPPCPRLHQRPFSHLSPETSLRLSPHLPLPRPAPPSSLPRWPGGARRGRTTRVSRRRLLRRRRSPLSRRPPSLLALPLAPMPTTQRWTRAQEA